MPQRVRAVVVDPDAPERLVLREVDGPSPAPNEALIRLAAFSLNLGEVRRAASAGAGWRPGWDVAGRVQRPAADGSGPATGARVVGMLSGGAWAEAVAVPTAMLAELPEGVSFAQAATLPIAGLTALRTLERGGNLLDRPVLVTGASGGVGHFALQLGRLAGARMVALVRRPERAAAAREAGASEVLVGESAAGAAAHGPYHLVLESVGGAVLGEVLGMLGDGGSCVLFGTSAAPEVTFDARAFYATGGASLYGFIIFREVARDPAGADLARLARLVATGRLRTAIDVEAPWTEVGVLARRLFERQIAGKAVLHVR